MEADARFGPGNYVNLGNGHFEPAHGVGKLDSFPMSLTIVDSSADPSWSPLYFLQHINRSTPSLITAPPLDREPISAGPFPALLLNLIGKDVSVKRVVYTFSRTESDKRCN